MRQSRSKIPGGIDRIASSSPKRESDTPDECRDKVWAQAWGWTRSRSRLGENRAHDKNQDERSQDLADQVRAKSADRRRGAEAGKFQALIGRLLQGRLLLSDAEKATLAEIAYRLGRKALQGLPSAQ